MMKNVNNLKNCDNSNKHVSTKKKNMYIIRVV